MNRVYPELMVALSQAVFDVTTATWEVYPVSTDSIYDASNVVLGDFTGTIIGAGQPLTFDGITNDGVAARYDTSGTVVFDDITSADDVLAFIIVANDGVDQRLAAWIDTRSDGTPAGFIGSGADVNMAFPSLWFMRV